ncbi:uncharacterized protein LOC109459863 [Rhinolophus sinicus]|uniref:uncharacterized protein LOC109459863 n=1 Tax=Rhinolophus sinicus TaxID=89399 RepID=UPI003D792E82
MPSLKTGLLAPSTAQGVNTLCIADLCRCSQWLATSKLMLSWKSRVARGYSRARLTSRHMVEQRSFFSTASLHPFSYKTKPFHSASERQEGRSPLIPEYLPTLRSRGGRKREQRLLCLKAGWEEVAVTLIKGSGGVSIESVQKSAEQVEGGGRQGAAGHEVERNDGEDNPGVTLGWNGGDREDHRACPRSLALPFGPEPRAVLTNEVRHKQEDIFAWHRGGPLAVPGPIRRCQLCPRPTARPHSPIGRIGCAYLRAGPRCPSPDSDVTARCRPDHGPPQMCAGRGGGERTHPALPMGRRSPPPARQALQPPPAAPAAQLCSASGNLLFGARACKIGQSAGEGGRKKGLKKMAPAPLRSARFLFLWSLRPFPSDRTKAQGEERGKETSTPSKGRHGTGEVKRKGSLDDYLYFPVCGGCDVLETEIRRKDSALPSLCVPETHGEWNPVLQGMRRKITAGCPKLQHPWVEKASLSRSEEFLTRISTELTDEALLVAGYLVNNVPTKEKQTQDQGTQLSKHVFFTNTRGTDTRSDRNRTRTKAHLLPSPRDKGALPGGLTSGG